MRNNANDSATHQIANDNDRIDRIDNETMTTEIMTMSGVALSDAVNDSDANGMKCSLFCVFLPSFGGTSSAGSNVSQNGVLAL